MDKLAKQEACQLFIEQEIEEGLAEGKTKYAIGQEIAQWIERLFGVEVKPNTIAKRALRLEEKLGTFVPNRSPEEFTDTELAIVKLYEASKKRKKEQFKEKIREEYKYPETFEPFLYDVWSVSKLNNKYKHPGNIPQEFIENLVHHYTEEGDLVYDPFAGGGPTIDVCKAWNRDYYVSDIAPIPERQEEIKQWDLRLGLPATLGNPTLTFLDPPYYKKKEDDYVEESISSMEIEEYMAFFVSLTVDLYEKHKPGTYVALLMSNYIDYEDYKKSIWIHDYVKIFIGTGFNIHRWIQCPLSTQQYSGFQVNQAKQNKKLLAISRDLVVFIKE